jgi:ERCC4-type nuclease
MALRMVVIDTREPDWLQGADFGCKVVTNQLDPGDVMAFCDDGQTLIIERKTPTDFLGTLKADRLFDQCGKLAQTRSSGFWPYLVITGEFLISRAGYVNCDGRDTGWNWSAVMGSLLSIQELGVYVHQCASDYDFPQAVIRLGNRRRTPEMIIEPKRNPKWIDSAGLIISSLPGIGTEKTAPILNHCGTVAKALSMMTDKNQFVPGIGPGLRKRIRESLGLKKTERIEITDEYTTGN